MPTAKDAEFYNMNHRRRGKAFVFNHMNFDPSLNLTTREGTNHDRDNLRVFLSQLGFEVAVYEDLSFKDIERILENASLEDHSDADCILVAGKTGLLIRFVIYDIPVLILVMSHGRNGSLCAYDQEYYADRFWSSFSADRCRTLAGKPKIFLIEVDYCIVMLKITRFFCRLARVMMRNMG